MTATSLAFRTILSHYLPGLLALPGTFGLVALIRMFAFGQKALVNDLFCWIGKNLGIASFGILVVPLFLGILLDMWRHGFWPMREDDDVRWNDGTVRLRRLPEFQFRFMYDEYYYYVEFEGNSALAGLVDLLVVPYIWLAYGPCRAFIVLAAVALLTVFCWVSRKRSLKEFFEDLEDIVT